MEKVLYTVWETYSVPFPLLNSAFPIAHQEDPDFSFPHSGFVVQSRHNEYILS